MNIIKCVYDDDNDTIQTVYDNGNTLYLKCSEIEEKLDTTIISRARLQWLLDNDPLSYLEMALGGELQTYCTEYNAASSELNNTVREQLLNSGYSESTAQNIADEFTRYDS